MLNRYVVSAIALCVALGTARAEDDAETKEHKAAFETWYATVKADWAKRRPAILAAEKAPRAVFEEGLALAKAGQDAKAEATFLAARKLLFAQDPTLVDFKVGLSYEIGAALAKLYEKQERTTHVQRELLLIGAGRPWLPEAEEQLFHAYTSWAAARRAKLSKAEQKRYDMVTGYLGIAGGGRVFAEGNALGNKLREARDAAGRLASTFKGDIETHYDVDRLPVHVPASMAETSGKKGRPWAYENAKVTAIQGKTVTLDFTGPKDVPFDCVQTNQIRSIKNGEVSYWEKCKHKTVKGGHRALLPAPADIKLTKGDVVSVYAMLVKVKGTFDVVYDKPAYLHVMRGGKSIYMFGVESTRPLFIDQEEIIDSYQPKDL
ncbi:MAG: hypothetical protein SFX73_04605 [Kofleriaceae bacterium]|nr:hypothetical protein [Kofleriaceae bacterium]